MEYHQMTINEWIDMKQRLQAELLGVRKSFVRIGYILRKIDESKGYENDGYRSVTEWAKGEYGMEGTTVSRFMSINREYSIGGYSEELLPEYEDYKRSQLEEMLKLPVEDRGMIRPETARADIRELKQFNKQEPAAGEADDFHQLVQRFFEDNPEILQEVYKVYGKNDTMKELIIPSGNRSYRKGAYYLMMYEDVLKLKKFGGKPEEYTWQQFFEIMTDIYGEELKHEDQESVEKKLETETVPEEHPAKEEPVVHNEGNAGTDAEPERTDAEPERIEERNEETPEKPEQTDPEAIDGMEEEPEAEEEIEEKDEKTEEENAIAPAQIFKENLEKNDIFEEKTEVIETPKRKKRKDLLNEMTETEAAYYLTAEYEKGTLKESLQFAWKMMQWMAEEVDVTEAMRKEEAENE